VPEAPGELGGGVDLAALESTLYAARQGAAPVIGIFTVASNITGSFCQVDAVTALCHAHGALAVWDAAAAASHVRLDVNPKAPSGDARTLAKDALFFSCHKLTGGPSTPGVLVVKRALLKGGAPNLPGGGTVMFVRPDGTPLYHANDAEREEGGTPDVVAAVRAGLCFQLLRAVGLR
jgi:selenocysteine lyase/cysteine desulfurase